MALSYGTLEFPNRSRLRVIDPEIVFPAKKTGNTQLLLLTGTAMATVTSLVSSVITEGVTLIVASRAEMEFSTA